MTLTELRNLQYEQQDLHNKLEILQLLRGKCNTVEFKTAAIGFVKLNLADDASLIEYLIEETISNVDNKLTAVNYHLAKAMEALSSL